MPRIKALIAIAAGVVVMAAAPAALALTVGLGDSTGTPTTNVCAAQIECTYVNFKHGKPADVLRRSGTLTDFTVNAGSVGGHVQLRVLRRLSHGRFKVLRSSPVETVSSPGPNTFAISLKVKAGNVLALSNDSSGIYMTSAPAGTCVRYIQGGLPDGASAKPSHIVPQLHLLLSAVVTG